MRLSLPIVVIAVCAIFTFGQSATRQRDYVPDEKTAVAIAEAVLVPVYGEKQIFSERPFKAKLDGDIWTVSGTLHCDDGKGGTTTGCVGGTAEVRLSKRDGRILFMIHYK